MLDNNNIKERGPLVEDVTNIKDKRTENWYKINKNLLPVKVLYFFFTAASGAVLPFITLYMKSLGLSSTETGIIFGVMPFLSLLIKPLFGFVADKTKRHRLVLISCSFMTGVSYSLLVVVPARPAPTNSMFPLYCDYHGSRALMYETVSMSGGSTTDYLQYNNELNVTDEICKTEYPNKTMVQTLRLCYTNHSILSDMEMDCESHTRDNDSSELILFQNLLKDDTNSYIYAKGCLRHHVRSITDNNLPRKVTVCSDEFEGECDIKCKVSAPNSLMDSTLWIFTTLYFLLNVFFQPVYNLLDAIAYDMLGHKKSRYGLQRLWGTIGYMVMAMGSSYIMESTSKPDEAMNFSWSLHLSLCLTAVSAFVAYFLRASSSLNCTMNLSGTCIVMRNIDVQIFSVIIFCYGIMSAVIEGFLFWYLIEIGSKQIIMGLSMAFRGVPEMIMLFFSGKIIKRLGHNTCFYLSAFAYAIRFFGYSVIPSAEYVLPIEALHGVTFGLFYSAATSYANVITPKGMSATVQGSLGGVYLGLSKGVSGFVAGKMYDRKTGVGPVWTFRCLSFFAVFVLVVSFIVQTLRSPAREGTQNDEIVAKSDLLPKGSEPKINRDIQLAEQP